MLMSRLREGRAKTARGAAHFLRETVGRARYAGGRGQLTLRAEIENAIRYLKYGFGLYHLPSGRFAANAAWLAVQVLAHKFARWTARIGLGEQVVTTKTLRRWFFSLAGRLTALGAPACPASPQVLALGSPVR